MEESTRCQYWWEGKYYDYEEGFLKIDVKNNDFSYEYIDYGWKVMNDKC